MNGKISSQNSDQLLSHTPILAGEKYDFRAVSIKIDLILKDKTRKSNDKIHTMFQLLDSCSHEINANILCKIVSKSLDLINANSTYTIQDYPINKTLSKIAKYLKYDVGDNVGDREYSGLFLKLAASGVIHEGFMLSFANYVEKKVTSFDPISLASSLKAVANYSQQIGQVTLLINGHNTLNEIKSKLIVELEKRNPNKYAFQPCIVILKAAAQDPEISKSNFIKKIQSRALDCCPETSLLDLMEALITIEPQKRNYYLLKFSEKLNNDLLSFSIKDFQRNQSFLAKLFVNNDTEEPVSTGMAELLRNIDLETASWSVKLSLAVACTDKSEHKWFADAVRYQLLNINPVELNKKLTSAELSFVPRLFMDPIRTREVKDLLSSMVYNFQNNFDYSDYSTGNIGVAVSLIQACAYNNFYNHALLKKTNDFFINVFEDLEISGLTTVLWSNTIFNYKSSKLLELIDRKLCDQFAKKNVSSMFICCLLWCSILHNEENLPNLLKKIDSNMQIKQILSSDPYRELQLQHAQLICGLRENVDMHVATNHINLFKNTGILNDFEKDIENDLRNMKLIKSNFNYEAQVALAGISVDFIINFNNRKYVLECDGIATHYLTNGQLRGNDLIQDKIFNRLGYEVIHISSDEYYNRKGRAILLAQKLNLDLIRNPNC
jgi:very-short-patch-repair endonuclease